MPGSLTVPARLNCDKTVVYQIYLKCIENDNVPLQQCVIEFQHYINSHDAILNLFEAALTEVPFDHDTIGNPLVRDLELFLRMLNLIIASPPRHENHFWSGVPIATIINWAMHTPSGHKLFLEKGVNEHFKIVLNQWAIFLSTPESRLYLTEDKDSGWIGASTCYDMDGTLISFGDLYECDPSKPFYGFASWDAYFSRQLRPGRRPIVDADNDNLIVNGCESAPYRLARNVKKEDEFWLKGQPYSFRHMLQDDESVDYFTGGTVYQAFLDAMNYHRWHSPVNGRVVRTRTVDGAFYAVCPAIGYDLTGCESQAYYCEVATRSLVFIECNNPSVGLMCFMAVGMGEVGTCEVTCKAGDTVRKGDQLGCFHFGGSTQCLLFGPQVKLHFDLGVSEDQLGLSSPIIQLHKNLARVL